MRLLLKVLLPVLILAIGGGVAFWLFSNPKEAQKGGHGPVQAQLVETVKVETGSYHARIEAMGQVVPAMEIDLKSRVSGEIIEMAESFIPGGLLRAGQEILKIDPEEYELAVRQQKAVLRQARADLQLEHGRQDVARQELEILARTTGRDIGKTDLALRRPQLVKAKAALSKEKAVLKRVRLDLRWTEVKAPFNAIVTAREAMTGDLSSAQDVLAILVNTDSYWVMLSVPVGDLKWLEFPDYADEAGSFATIIQDGGRGTRDGYILKLTGTLNEKTRMAGVLVEVPDPLLLQADRLENETALILGDYVKVKLKGRKMGPMVRIRLSWLRDGRVVYVANEDGTMRLRPVEILYQDRDFAYISSGLVEGEAIITSNIPVVVDGMKIRTMEEARNDVQQKMLGPKGPVKDKD